MLITAIPAEAGIQKTYAIEGGAHWTPVLQRRIFDLRRGGVKEGVAGKGADSGLGMAEGATNRDLKPVNYLEPEALSTLEESFSQANLRP